jgi:hypothetical protein
VSGRPNKHVIAFESSKLKIGERIVSHISGYIGGSGKDEKFPHDGSFIVTDQRVVFYRKGFFGEVFETIPLNKITSVETKSLFGHRILTLHTAHDEMKFKTNGPRMCSIKFALISKMSATRIPQPTIHLSLYKIPQLDSKSLLI